MKFIRVIDTEKRGYVQEIDTDKLSDEELAERAKDGEIWAVIELAKRGSNR